MSDEQTKTPTPLEEAQARLKAAQERRATAAASLELKRLEAEIRTADRDAEDDEFAATLQGRLDGELGVDFDFLRFGDHLVAIKRPARLTQDAWNKKVSALGGKLPDGAEIRNHVKRCLVPLEGEGGEKAATTHFDKLAEIFTDAPLLCLNLANELAQGGVARRRGK